MADNAEREELLKRAYEHGRECGECVREFDYDPGKNTLTAMFEYRMSADHPYPAFMYVDSTDSVNTDLLVEWHRGFIDGYESIQEEES